MKIFLENPTKMLIKNNNYSLFVFGLIFGLVGIGVAYFTYSQGSNQLEGIGFGAIFALAGLALIVFNKSTTVVLDKGMGSGFFSIKTLIKKEEKEIEIKKIKQLELKCWRQSNNNGASQYKYTLNFILNEIDEITIDFGGQGGMSIGGIWLSFNPHQKRIEDAQKIADFIGVKMTFVPPPSLTDALKAIKEGITEGIKQNKKLE